MFVKAFVLGAIASLAAAQSSVLKFNLVPNPITEGSATALTWLTNDTVSPVTITLRKGVATNLQTIEVLTSSGTGSQYIWTPCTALPDGSDYALEIQQNSQTNYFGPLTLQGYTGQGTCAGLVTSSTSSTSSASATSNSTVTSSTMSMTSSAASSTGSTSSQASSSTGSPTSSVPATTTSNAAGFQSSNPSTHTNAASALAAGGSSVALLIGAVAAIVMA